MKTDIKCCATCDWFALQPGKRRSGACLNRWMPLARYNDEVCYGAYGRTFPWEKCDHWTPQGSIKRLDPLII